MGDAPTIHVVEAPTSVVASRDVTSTNVLPQLRTRVVREEGRETWFVVNESDDDLATIPLAVAGGSGVRRVQVNGEVAEFSASADILLVRPRRSLRVGAGTIVSVQFR